MNVVMTGEGRYVEIQGTAEGVPFTREELDELLSFASKGIDEIISLEKDYVASEPEFRKILTGH